MKTLMQLFIAALLALALPVLADAPTPAVQDTVQSTNQTALEACPLPAENLLLNQVSQADCCKGNKGVCGCRSGKIVCCDGTISPNCTCHAETDFAY